MKTLQNIIMTTLLVIGMSMTQGLAKESQRSKEKTTQSEIQVLDKKIAAIQLEIDTLESKGKQNLTKEDKIKRMHLKKKLLAVMRQKTAQQRKIIAEENRKQKALDRVNEKLDSIQGALSSTGTTK